VVVVFTDFTETPPEEGYNLSSDVLLFDPDTLKKLGVDKEIIRKQFEYVYKLLSCNRENIVMLALFLTLYSENENVGTFTQEFDTVDEFHVFCDQYFDWDYHKEFYDRCLKRIES